jgi:hypothetical protein
MVVCVHALEEERRDATIPSDQYLPSMTEPFGISFHETLVQGLVCLKFNSTIRQVSNQPGPVEGLQGKLHAGDLFELEPAN